MSREKVVVPEYVAEAIEDLRKHGRNNFDIADQIKGALYTHTLTEAKEWTFEGGGGSPDLLMDAIVNGYEVKKTPEEKLREYYDGYEKTSILENPAEISRRAGARQGIRLALNILGITIEGING